MYKIKLKSSDAFGVFRAEYPYQVGDLIASVAAVHDGPVSAEIEFQEDEGKQEAEKDGAE